MADAGQDVLRAVPLLSAVPAATRHAVQARGVRLDVAAGDEVIRRWDADRFFYIALAGRYDVFIDARLIRTLGPGDHFGELAARDWGGGYGYARLATVRCTEPGRLLRLTGKDLQWLATPNRRSRPSSLPAWPNVSRIASALPGAAGLQPGPARAGPGWAGLGRPLPTL